MAAGLARPARQVGRTLQRGTGLAAIPATGVGASDGGPKATGHDGGAAPTASPGFPDTDIRPYDYYLRVKAAGLGDSRAAYSLDADASPSRWERLDWRLLDGTPVTLSTRPSGPGVLQVSDLAAYLARWHGGTAADDLDSVADGGTRWAALPRGLRTPNAIASDPSLVELCGRDSVLLDLADADPDAILRNAVASYGPAVLRMCEWPGCAALAAKGRGTAGRLCHRHARRSGTDRKAARLRARPETDMGPDR
jgi:hypothetical protein